MDVAGEVLVANQGRIIVFTGLRIVRLTPNGQLDTSAEPTMINMALTGKFEGGPLMGITAIDLHRASPGAKKTQFLLRI